MENRGEGGMEGGEEEEDNAQLSGKTEVFSATPGPGCHGLTPASLITYVAQLITFCFDTHSCLSPETGSTQVFRIGKPESPQRR